MADPREEKISFDFEVEHFEDEDQYEGEAEDDTATPSAVPTYSAPQRSENYKQIVCWKWLENLCTKDDATCNFLHRYDKSRMPICRHLVKYGECLNRQNCVYKHTIDEVKECVM